MQAVVVTFDRLALGFLGCYGNEWIETPNFDRLAAEGIVFDQHFGENFDIAAVNHAWWTGCYQFPRTGEQQRSLRDLANFLPAADVATTLLVERRSDSDADREELPRFDTIREVRGRDDFDAKPRELPFARLVTKAKELLSGRGTGVPTAREVTNHRRDARATLLWLKSAGVPSPWLPPRDFATFYFDEFAERGLLAEPPPDDEWSTSRIVYAGYVTLLDYWLGQLLEVLDEQRGDGPQLLIVTAARGERFEELQHTGNERSGLEDAVVHTPLLVRLRGDAAAEAQAGSRRQELVQTVDLVPTLLEFFGLEAGPRLEGRSWLPLARDEARTPREFLCLGEGRTVLGVRTPKFYGVQEAETGPESMRLYVKPDDLWDVLDVGRQHPEDVERLSKFLDEFLSRI